MTDQFRERALQAARQAEANLGADTSGVIRALLQLEMMEGHGPKDACDHVADFMVAIYQMVENLTVEEIMAIKANVSAVTFCYQEDLKRQAQARFS